MKTKLIGLKLLLILVSSNLMIVGCSSDDKFIDFEIVEEDQVEGDQVEGDQVEGDGLITSYSVSEHGDLSKIMDYPVTGVNLDLQRDTEKHMKTWSLVKQIIPQEYIAKINQFVIFSSKDTGVGGRVAPNKDHTKWRLAVGIDIIYSGGVINLEWLEKLVIHEFAHIFTLDASQYDFSINEEDCSSFLNVFYTIDIKVGGCHKSDSYLNKLYQAYWADIWSEFELTWGKPQEALKFYNKYKERFVTQYASTHPTEDIAEVFEDFVFLDEKPTTDTTASKKILMMYDRPELVLLREQIRANVAQINGNNKSLLKEKSLQNTDIFFKGKYKSICGFHN